MKTPQKGKKQKVQINVLSIVLSIFSIFFVVGGALAIYYFSKGYRINITDREIRRTGVITVQTQPSGARLYIDGEDVGRTPRSRTLDVGIHNISVWRDGYHEWRKDVEILEQKSTPVFPFLILEDIEMTNIWESEGEIVQYWINEDQNHFIYLQQDLPEQYSLWRYRVNTPIWNLNNNPVQILTLDTSDIELKISPNGQFAIMKITEENENIYVVDLTRPTLMENLLPVEILAEYDIQECTWSKDNRHIIIETEDEILSFDTSQQGDILYTLLEKENGVEILWNTDEEGFFYTLEALHTEEGDTYQYALKQTLPDGTNPKYTIEKVYFQKDESFIEHYRENGDSYPEFTNSPHSTQTIGSVISFEVNQSSNGIFISTNTSAYWYNIETDRYQMICAYPAQLLSFSPNSKRILFENGNRIYVYTLDKEEGNHTEKIGTEKVSDIRKDAVEQIAWLSNSSHLHYIENNLLYISERDGENKTVTIDMEDILIHTIKDSSDYIVTLEVSEDEILQINQYRIN